MEKYTGPKAPANYMRIRDEIASGKTNALNIAVGMHPAAGPFVVLAVRNELMRDTGKCTEWIIPAEEAATLMEMLHRGLNGLKDILEDMVEGSPSKCNH